MLTKLCRYRNDIDDIDDIVTVCRYRCWRNIVDIVTISTISTKSVDIVTISTMSTISSHCASIEVDKTLSISFRYRRYRRNLCRYRNDIDDIVTVCRYRCRRNLVDIVTISTISYSWSVLDMYGRKCIFEKNGELCQNARFSAIFPHCVEVFDSRWPIGVW